MEIHVTMDMITWTETFYLNLIKTGDNSTRVVLGRIGLAQPADWGIAKQHIEQLLLKLESTLQHVNQSVDERNQSMKDQHREPDITDRTSTTQIRSQVCAAADRHP